MAFYIQAVQSGKYLDIKDGSTNSGTEVILFDFTGGENQQWKYKNGMLISKLNGMALDIEDGSENGKIIVFEKNGNDNQKWFFDPDFTIRSGTGTVLDVKDSSVDNYTGLNAWAKHGNDNQKFRVVPVNDD